MLLSAATPHARAYLPLRGRLHQEAVVAAEAAEARAAATKAQSLLSGHAAASPTKHSAMFAQDSRNVRERMRHALEDGLADSVVVASATTIAMGFLQRRYLYPLLLPRLQASGNSSTQRGRGSRRRRLPSGHAMSALLAATCLHLASKYHCVQELPADMFAPSPRLSKIFDLGK